MSFFNLIDFKSKDLVNDYLSLKVSRSRGVETVPNMNINITKLNRDTNNTLYQQFFNNGYAGVTVKVEVLIKETDTYNNKKVLDVLDEWVQNMTILAVQTKALNMPDGQYIITGNPSRTQNMDGSSVWVLEFTTYTPLNVIKYKNDLSSVLNAVNKIKAKKASSVNSKLSKCNYKVLVYSKKKKKVTCVKYMQQILYKQKLLKKSQVDGWFGKETKAAVKKFQKKYNKTHKITINVKSGDKLTNNAKLVSKRLKVTGKVDKATWKALCEA